MEVIVLDGSEAVGDTDTFISRSLGDEFYRFRSCGWRYKCSLKAKDKDKDSEFIQWRDY